ncbi:hypothetical protein CVIRNUC_009682 [Coccomyxa viridis]|uniref:Fe2OG dioxygenase domain-containing protein n=1 Tax=Coccomyxa viridis TaxID=1274662 RepID=A0AAV1IKK1_9CHLO|nr:hypothetical protein CVIRNUC_009682 [Coccomyxa viridis]
MVEVQDLDILTERMQQALGIVDKRQDNIYRLRCEAEEAYTREAKALEERFRRKDAEWVKQMDHLEEQQQQLLLGVGAASMGRDPRNLDQIVEVLKEVLPTKLAARNWGDRGRAVSEEVSDGRMRGYTNGYAQQHDPDAEDGDDDDDDADANEADTDEHEEENEEEKQNAFTPRLKPQMVPRQVALRQNKPEAPPGFEDEESPGSAVPPPGFDARPAVRSPAGHSRATNGFSKTPSPAKESRGAADMRPNDLRNLLSRRKEGSLPNLVRTARPDGSEDDAPAVLDARELINARKREPQDTLASRAVREWDAGKEPMQEDLPGDRPARPPRLPVPLYQPRARERPAEVAPPPPPPPPPPPGFPSGGEPQAPPPQSGRSPPRAPSGILEDGFQAPSSPMVDPEEGDRDRAYFGNGHSEDTSAITQDEQFPSLGAAAKSEDAEVSSAPQLKGAWGSGSIASRLAQAQKDPATLSSPAPGSADMVAYEQRAGLRPANDHAPDRERRQQMRSKKDFVHEEDVRAPRRLGWRNVVEGLELHKNLLSPAEEDIFVDAIRRWEEEGRAGCFRGRTFSAPRKSMRGKGRVTIQFGCCYNYAVDKEGRPPGIIPEEVVEPMPDLLVALVKRLVRWGVLPARMAPDSAIINIYDVIDCIPPHIDHHDFSRPFCTISLLSQQSIMFGHKLIPLSAGEFVGATCESFLLPLPTGSCLVLKGNGADLAMHCVPPVTERRMSITLRRMGPQYADQVRLQAERAMQRQVPRLPRSWADDTVDDATPKRYGADDWEEAEADRVSRLQRF